jgi:hypothetical protein
MMMRLPQLSGAAQIALSSDLHVDSLDPRLVVAQSGL